MAIKLPEELIGSIEFESSLPEMKMNSCKNEDGSMSITYGYDASAIHDYTNMIAREMNEKIEVALMDELMTMNGYVKANACPICQGEVMLMGDKVFIKDFGHYTKEKAGHVDHVKSGTLYDVYRYNCCGYEHSESRTDAGASEIPMNFCPNCGAKVVDVEWKGWQ